jgi:hypothetical protein
MPTSFRVWETILQPESGNSCFISISNEITAPLCQGTMIKKKNKRLQEMLDEIIDAKPDNTKEIN